MYSFYRTPLITRINCNGKKRARKGLKTPKNIIKFQQEALQKQQDLEDKRARIASDMYDDLGSELTKINYLEQMALNAKNPAENLEK